MTDGAPSVSRPRRPRGSARAGCDDGDIAPRPRPAIASRVD